jgi:hypothetical protein
VKGIVRFAGAVKWLLLMVVPAPVGIGAARVNYSSAGVESGLGGDPIQRRVGFWNLWKAHAVRTLRYSGNAQPRRH